MAGIFEAEAQISTATALASAELQRDLAPEVEELPERQVRQGSSDILALATFSGVSRALLRLTSSLQARTMECAQSFAS